MGVYGALGVFQGMEENIFSIKLITIQSPLAGALLVTSLIFAIGCLRAARDLHNKLLNNVLRLPMAFFDTTPLGRILNRFSKGKIPNNFEKDNIINFYPLGIVQTKILLTMCCRWLW
jgi:ABC-type multidrug transport system fused ATPase/permease subunit